MSVSLQDYWDGPLPDPDIRTPNEILSVLANRECSTLPGALYYMYRNLARNPEDREWLEAQDLRYDITVIPPGSLCREYVKTKGHYHPDDPGGVGYPELYQVLAGLAHYLFQNRDVSDVVVCTARGGEAVLVPPGYGHVTINPGSDPIVMANLVSSQFESDYMFFEKMEGAAYYELVGEDWVKNSRYGQIPDLRLCTPPEVPELCITHGTNIYELIGRKECLDYLNHPERYRDLLAELY